MNLKENDISRIVLDTSIKIHEQLGPGLLESAYEECLCYELSKNRLFVERQKSLPLIYENIRLDAGYRIDLFIENKVIVELKAVETILPIHKAQLLTYLKLSNCKLGLLINFNVQLLKNGFTRMVNNL